MLSALRGRFSGCVVMVVFLVGHGKEMSCCRPSLQVLRAETMVERFSARLHVSGMSMTFSLPVQILTIVFDIRPLICRKICAGGYGRAGVLQKNSWQKICGGQGQV